MLVVEAKALMLFDLFRTCSTLERFRYSNAGIELSLTSPHRANMENNQLAVQDISNYHGYDDGKCLSCPCLPYWQKINTPGVHKYCFSCYVCQGGWGGRSRGGRWHTGVSGPSRGVGHGANRSWRHVPSAFQCINPWAWRQGP